jgi:hypothetical protein
VEKTGSGKLKKTDEGEGGGRSKNRIFLTDLSYWTAPYFYLEIIKKNFFIAGAEQTNHRLIVSLCLILGINLLGWLTPALASVILVATNVDRADFTKIFLIVGNTSVGLATCAMCPVLYAIKLAIFCFFG